MRIIDIILITFCLIYIASSNTQAQKFEDPIVNPFGIFADTTGGVSIYTCEFVDFDGDQDLDLIYTYIDDSFQLAIQENIGSATNPNFSPIEKLNYSFDTPNGLFIPTFADLNSDGLIDIVSFGNIDNSSGFNSSYYVNEGDKSFAMIDGPSIGLPGIGYALGVPEIVDINLDGDLDLILAGSTFETFTDEADAFFYFAQNSNKSSPEFVAWFVEPYSFAFMDTFQSAIIRAGDLDLDGDVDLLMNISINDEETRFMYQENISPPTTKVDFSGDHIVLPFNLPDNVQGLHFLEDLDGDGDLDLLVYNDLEISYFENSACINTTEIISVELCNEDAFMLNNETYTESGIYTQMLSNHAGCDSILTLDLKLNQNKESFYSELICMGDIFTWNGIEYSEAGDFVQTLISSDGCDSIVTLNLKLNESKETFYSELICMGDIFTWNGIDYSQAGDFVQTLISSDGCDSTVTLTLGVVDILLEIMVNNDTLSVDLNNGSISWINCATNMVIEGADSNVFIPSEPGNYAAQVIVDGCEIRSDCVAVSISTTDEHIPIGFNIYPNPAQDYLHVDLNNQSKFPMRVRIIDASGKVEEVLMENSDIDIRHFPNGAYVLSLLENESWYSVPFIINR